MARKKSCCCHSCGKKIYVENAVRLDDDEEYPIYWCCQDCKNATFDEEILNEKIYILFKDILGVKTLNKTVRGFIRNRLNDDFDDKREILFNVLKAKKEKIKQNIAEKTFPQTIAKAKYVFACVKRDVESEFEQRQKQQKFEMNNFEFSVPLTKTIVRKIKDISNWLN